MTFHECFKIALHILYIHECHVVHERLKQSDCFDVIIFESHLCLDHFVFDLVFQFSISRFVSQDLMISM